MYRTYVARRIIMDWFSFYFQTQNLSRFARLANLKPRYTYRYRYDRLEHRGSNANRLVPFPPNHVSFHRWNTLLSDFRSDASAYSDESFDLPVSAWIIEHDVSNRGISSKLERRICVFSAHWQSRADKFQCSIIVANIGGRGNTEQRNEKPIERIVSRKSHGN